MQIRNAIVTAALLSGLLDKSDVPEPTQPVRGSLTLSWLKPATF
jgi:hypothetical protein